MPKNYNRASKIDAGFMEFNDDQMNHKLFRCIVNGEYINISEQVDSTLPPNMLCLRFGNEPSFKIALVDDYSRRILYYIDCVTKLDICIGDTNATQVLLWRTSDVRHRPITSGFADKVFEYLLDEHSIVASNIYQTSEGRDFWVRQLGYSLAKGLYVYRYEVISCKKTRITDHACIRNNSVDLWGDEDKYSDILAVISKIELDT